MSNLPSVANYIQTEATRFRSAVSESVIQDVGSSINYILDDNITQNTNIATLTTQVSNLNNALPNIVWGLDLTTPFLAEAAVITKEAGSYVRVQLQPSSAVADFSSLVSGSFGSLRVTILRNSVGIARMQLLAAAGGTGSVVFSWGAINFVDNNTSAGTYTYQISLGTTGISLTTLSIVNIRIMAEEIRLGT